MCCSQYFIIGHLSFVLAHLNPIILAKGEQAGRMGTTWRRAEGKGRSFVPKP